jgi:GT2 family glycosyltransferase
MIVFAEEPAPLASVIVVGWRRAPYLLDCLRALVRSVRRVPYEVILVLNEPAPELVAAVQATVRGARVVQTAANVGFAGAVNRAAEEAGGEYIVLLNDDTEVESDWLEQLVETADRRRDAGAVGSTMLFPDGTIQEAGSVLWDDASTLTVGRGLPGASRRFDYERRVDFTSGGSLLIRRESFRALGGMSLDYFPAYYEDTDFCLRLAERGESVWYQPRSRVMHHESTSTNETYRNFLFEKNKQQLRARFADVLAQRVRAAPWDPAAVEEAVWRAMGAPERILLIDDQVPVPAKGSGMPRMAEVVTALQETGRYQVSVWTSLVDGGTDNDLLCRLGVEVLDDPLEEHLALPGRRYAAAVFSRPHNYERYAPLVRAAHPRAALVYDAEALFFRRIEREALLRRGTALADDLAAAAATMRECEAAIAADADHVVAISAEEAAELRATASCPVEVHGPLLSNIAPSAASYAQRRDLAFVAGWAAGADSPNSDGLAWFAREVLPKLRARVPDARLLVTGVGPPRGLLRLAGPGLCFIGAVADLADLYDSVRVVVVPMRYGAGVKNKTIEALQFAVPTVSTTVGAEGLPLDDPDAVTVADDATTFAAAVASLLEDPAAWSLARRRLLAQGERWEASRPETIWPGVLERAIARARRRADAAVGTPRTVPQAWLP